MRHLKAHCKLGPYWLRAASVARVMTTPLRTKELRPFIQRNNSLSRCVKNPAGVELGKRYAERPGGYTRIIRLSRRDGDNAELAIIELVDNPREREALDSKKIKSAASGKKKSAKAGSKAEASSAESTKKASGGRCLAKKTESTAAEQETE